MNLIKRISFPLVSLLLLILLSSWGYRGHTKISECAPPCFPSSVSFLLGNFSTILVDSALAPDDRKQWDDTEAPKHYIDIDNYPEFQYYGKIPMTWDSITQAHSVSFILDNGIVPWATIATYDSLKNCFARQDMNKAALFAADLGHYVGDSHNPLHITSNFDGQNTGNDGIHSRYETRMINSYYTQILYPVDSAQLIPDVQSFVFSYIYANFVYVDSVLKADRDATTLVGNTNSSAYTTALWNNSKGFTIPLFRHASFALASLIYTAYIESQNMAVGQVQRGSAGLGQNFPNPVKDYTVIPFEVDQNNTFVSLKIMDALGNTRADLVEKNMEKGHHEIVWDARGLSNGCYFYIFTADDKVCTKKLMLMH